ncbi:MAG: DEAD/DEAH box helicase, partial [Lactobacillaceae bacterium]|nr:DEAD/DEAH box helicase [Lactobacillaceae bacterium]
KRKISASIEDIADELIELYAQRAAEKGFAFSPDGDAQRNFDDDFPYAETDDQIQSIREIKADMEKEKPMDRLLVGDVGFGKTEVAMRAAFKAVNDHKQVAFLAPTTILAQQHFQTLTDRFADFPEVRIAVMSRFNTPSENKKIATRAKNHEVDIVIGTHRLLSKDVEFKDLGLLIIDEEQRFGVKHKERIKQMRNNVDVLTLTATPIPRTLNMALVGARDLSVLETPPANRFPIQTYVLENNWPVIVDAIEKEMARGGQTFFVHNKVIDIESTVANIQALVSGANVGYIHGQMAENQVENVLMDFLDGVYDVLVTTTIIETGVDIPNANTLIVENAQNFGLSSLYQLRGRIGRSNRLAYSYFTYPADKQPNEDAQKRLEAIRDFTELGSGFKLAMRDLSIRGAGDLLGKQQHGFINSVGYELFQEMLSDAVNAKQNKQKMRPKTNAELVISIQAFIPDSYIPDSGQKMEMYQRIRQSKTDEQTTEAKNDLVDRFGEYPVEVTNLFTLMELKNIADASNVVNIRQTNKEYRITFDRVVTGVLTGEKVFELLDHLKYKAKVNATNDQFVITAISNDDVATSIQEITKYLKAVNEELKFK